MRKKEGTPVKNSMRLAFTAILLVSAAPTVLAAPTSPWPMPQSSVIALAAPTSPLPMPQIAMAAPTSPLPMPQAHLA